MTKVTEIIESKPIRRFVQAVQEISLARDLETVMRVVRTAAREITGADGATFVLREGNLCYYADEDAITPLWKGLRFPMSTCVSGWVMLNKKSATIPDIYKDPRVPHEAYAPTFVKSMAMVPIRQMEPIGAIGNYWAKQHTPTSEEIELLQSLADITSVALENVKVYNELEQRVAARTKELEFLNKELESFSYSVSHDLRAPLRAVLGFSHILNEDYSSKLDDAARELITDICSNAEQMAKLIDDLLEFSRTGRLDLMKFEIDQKPMVEDVCSNIRRANPGSKVEIHVGSLPVVVADAALLKQVWINLISNAVKYSSKSPAPEVSIGYAETKDEYEFFVRDNGAGFDMKYYDKLFSVFQRLHKRTDYEGTGIGLAIVAKIISRHGGTVRAEGKPGEGATFYFTLPK